MRGQFYSVIAIFVTVAIVAIVSIFVTSQGGDTGVYESIVADQIHQAETNVERDFEKAIVTSGKRAMLAGDDYVVMNGVPITNASASIVELMENGTINGNESLLMFNNTIANWTSKMLNIPSNFIINISHSGLGISDGGPFHISAFAMLNVSASDELGIARIDKKNQNYEISIPIDGAEDPLFALKTNGVVTRTIKISPYPYRAKKLATGGMNSSGNCSGNVTFDKADCNLKILVAKNVTGITFPCFSGFILEDSINLSGNSDCYVTGDPGSVDEISDAVANANYGKIYIDGNTKSAWHLPVRDEIDEKYYFAGNGPVFLKRLEGNLNRTSDGLETFVNLPELESYSIPIKENVISVDYIYFGDQDYIGYSIRGLQSWFRLNRTFADQYNLTELCDGC
jgi:hypothetical protein